MFLYSLIICFRSFEKRASSARPLVGFFFSLDMIFQTWRSILRNSFSSAHFGPGLASSIERRKLIDSRTSFPSLYSSVGSEPRIRAEFKKFLTRIRENRVTDLRRADIPAVYCPRSTDPLADTSSTNYPCNIMSLTLLSRTAIRNYPPQTPAARIKTLPRNNNGCTNGFPV